MLAQLSRLVLLVRGTEGVSSAVYFYHKAVGLSIVRATDEWAELTAGPGVTLHIKAAHTEQQLSVGYSPWITFEVDNMDQTVAACAQAGGALDGPIQYPAYGKIAVLRTPDNHMIGLYEPSH